MRFPLAVLGALAILSLGGGLASGQRPVSPAPTQRPVTTGVSNPPPDTGHGTARQRQVEAGVERRARERTDENGSGTGSGGATPPPPPPPAPPPPRILRPMAAPRAKEFLEGLTERALAARTVTIQAGLRVFGQTDGRVHEMKAAIFSLREAGGVLRHRILLTDVAGGKESLRDLFLIHEFVGERPQAWHLGKDRKAEPFVGDPFGYVLVPGRPFTLLDILPFEPGRYRLEVEGEGERDGQPVVHLRGRSAVGRAEDLEVVCHRFSGLRLRERAVTVDRRVVWEAMDSVPRNRDGVTACEDRRILHETREAMLVYRTLDRHVNRVLDPALFEPGGLVP